MVVTPEDFAILHEACEALEDAGVPYVVGGGTVVTIWGRNRRTKDFDVFLNRESQEVAMNALSLANFTTTDTEKRWLYKAWRGDTLVDLIVESRGGVQVDTVTLHHARLIHQHGFDFRVMGPEDTLYRKILTLTEGRPDWYDALSILTRQVGQLDWDYLLTLARRHPRRVLSFLLFAQTELHAPAGSPLSAIEDQLFSGEAPGLIPEWVVFQLIRHIWLGDKRWLPSRRLQYLPRDGVRVMASRKIT